MSVMSAIDNMTPSLCCNRVRCFDASNNLSQHSSENSVYGPQQWSAVWAPALTAQFLIFDSRQWVDLSPTDHEQTGNQSMLMCTSVVTETMSRTRTWVPSSSNVTREGRSLA